MFLCQAFILKLQLRITYLRNEGYLYLPDVISLRLTLNELKRDKGWESTDLEEQCVTLPGHRRACSVCSSLFVAQNVALTSLRLWTLANKKAGLSQISDR